MKSSILILKHVGQRAPGLINWASGLFVLVCLVWLGGNVDRGLDITDEGIYLLSSHYPEAVGASTSRFGFYTGLFFSSVSYSIPAFRLSGILVTCVVMILLAQSIWSYWSRQHGSALDGSTKVAIFIGLLGCGLMYYSPWVLTPSYNWLALIGCSIVAIGAMRVAVPAVRFSHAKTAFDSLVIGAGGVIAFLAKPTTGLVLGLTMLLWVAVSRQSWSGRLRTMMLSLVFAALLLCAHVYYFDGGMLAFVEGLIHGAELARIQGGGYDAGSLLRGATTDLRSILSLASERIPLASLISGLAILGYIGTKIAGVCPNRITVIIKLLMPVFLISASLELYFLRNLGGDPWQIGPSLFAVSGVVLLICLCITWLVPRGEYASPYRNMKSLGLFCVLALLFGIAFAFGSNNGLLRQMSLGAVFLSLIVLYCGFYLDQLLGMKINLSLSVLALSILTMVLISRGMTEPYRLNGPISSQSVAVQLLGEGGEASRTVLVEEETAKYIEGLKAAAVVNGWEPNQYLLDFTGGSPGALVVLGARFVGMPAILGGYPGSEQLALAVWSTVSAEQLDRAWVLTAPSGWRSLSLSIFTELDMNFPVDYVEVGRVTSGHRGEQQVLWKPREQVGRTKLTDESNLSRTE